MIQLAPIGGWLLGSFFLVVLAETRGHPIAFKNRWYAGFSLALTLAFFALQYSRSYWSSWGVSFSVGVALCFVTPICIVALAVHYFPKWWTNILVLGVEHGDMRRLLRQKVRSCDPAAFFEDDTWQSPAYDASVRLVPSFGASTMVLVVSGSDAVLLSQDLLAELQPNLSALPLSSIWLTFRRVFFFSLAIIGAILFCFALANAFQGMQ